MKYKTPFGPYIIKSLDNQPVRMKRVRAFVDDYRATLPEEVRVIDDALRNGFMPDEDVERYNYFVRDHIHVGKSKREEAGIVTKGTRRVANILLGRGNKENALPKGAEIVLADCFDGGVLKSKHRNKLYRALERSGQDPRQYEGAISRLGAYLSGKR